VAALDHSGKRVWTQDLGPFASQHGGGHSPVLYDGMLIVANEQDNESFIAALDAATGEVRWKTARKTAEAVYSTPCVFEAKGRKPELIFNSEAHGISGVDPASGQVLWEFTDAFDKRVVSSPVIAGDLIIGSCGSGGGGNYVIAVRPGDKSRKAKPEAVYSVRRSAPYVPTSVYHGGLLFLWSDGGIVSCVDAVSGEIKYQERVGGNFFSSPVLTDHRLFGISTRGEVVVVRPRRASKYWRETR
jgi:outer membrane protein assembly factor BamB